MINGMVLHKTTSTTMATTTNTSSHQIFQHITNMLGTEYLHYFVIALIWTDMFIYELFITY